MFFSLVFLSLLSAFLFVEKSNVKLPIKLVLLIAVIIRFLITFIFLNSKSEDISTFIRDGQFLIEGSKKYESSYFPFIGYLGMIAIYLKNFINPYIFLKIIFTIFDLSILLPLYYLTKKNAQSVLLYALNPISIIVINIHGQMDSIPLFLLLLGIHFFLKNRILYSIFIISLAVYTKSWPALFIFPLFRRTRKKALFALIVLMPLIFLIIHSVLFQTSTTEVLRAVKNYRGLYGWWGFSEIFKPLKLLLPYHIYLDFQQLLRSIFLLTFLFFSLTFDFKNILKGITRLMLFFFVFSPTFGAQWLIWLIPFLIITKPKHFKYFFIISTFYLAIAFYRDVYSVSTIFSNFINFSAHLIGLTVWFYVLLMFIKSKNNLKSEF